MTYISSFFHQLNQRYIFTYSIEYVKFVAPFTLFYNAMRLLIEFFLTLSVIIVLAYLIIYPKTSSKQVNNFYL